jgi:hypothetical protein
MATTRVERRILTFRSLDDVLRDAEQLAARDHRTTGNWTYGQILHHLAKGADACFDGFGATFVPWWARWFIAPLVKKQFLMMRLVDGIFVNEFLTVLSSVW